MKNSLKIDYSAILLLLKYFAFIWSCWLIKADYTDLNSRKKNSCFECGVQCPSFDQKLGSKHFCMDLSVQRFFSKLYVCSSGTLVAESAVYNLKV